MLAPKTNIVNNCQNSLRDELICLTILNRDYEGGKVFSNSGLMTESSLKKLTIKAVICTIISAKIIRHQTIRVSKLKAVMVEIMVIGFMIGAAKRKLITSAGFNPFVIKLRAIGTLPHSHTGKISPIIESAIRRRKAFLVTF